MLGFGGCCSFQGLTIYCLASFRRGSRYAIVAPCLAESSPDEHSIHRQGSITQDFAVPIALINCKSMINSGDQICQSGLSGKRIVRSKRRGAGVSSQPRRRGCQIEFRAGVHGRTVFFSGMATCITRILSLFGNYK